MARMEEELVGPGKIGGRHRRQSSHIDDEDNTNASDWPNFLTHAAANLDTGFWILDVAVVDNRFLAEDIELHRRIMTAVGDEATTSASSSSQQTLVIEEVE